MAPNDEENRGGDGSDGSGVPFNYSFPSPASPSHSEPFSFFLHHLSRYTEIFVVNAAAEGGGASSLSSSSSPREREWGTGGGGGSRTTNWKRAIRAYTFSDKTRGNSTKRERLRHYSQTEK